MNQFLASSILAAVVLALVYVFMRVMRLEKDVKELRNRAPPMDLAQAVWGMASEPAQEMVFAPPPQKPIEEMFADHPPALNQAVIEEDLEEEEEELVGAFPDPAPVQAPPAEPPRPKDSLDQPVKDPTALMARRPTMRKKKPPAQEE